MRIGIDRSVIEREVYREVMEKVDWISIDKIVVESFG